MQENNRYCPECGNPLKPDATFCTNCGSPINTEKSHSLKSAYVQRPPSKPTRMVVEENKPQGHKNKSLIAIIVCAAVVVVVAVCVTVVLVTNNKREVAEEEEVEIVTGFETPSAQASDARFPGETGSGDWRFESFDWLSNRYVRYDEINDLSPYRLRLLRNAIFAMHNYSFKSDDLRDYFSRYPWYSPDYTDVTSQLSTIELKNIELIKSYE